MEYAVVSGPATQPLTVDEAKDHLRVDTNTEDAYIAGLIGAAVAYVEGKTESRLVSQQLRLRLDYFPSSIQLPIGPISAIDSITYKDTAGNTQTLAASEYATDLDNYPARITPAYGKWWPSTYVEIGAVTVLFTVGYADFSAVPDALKQAILIMIGHWYEHREPIVTGTIVSEVPMAVDALIGPYRRFAC